MPKKLAELKIEEVSVVDAGANQDAHITLWKRAPTQTTGDGAQKIELTKEAPVAEETKAAETSNVETLTTDLDSVQKRNAQLETELAKVRTELQAEVEKSVKELEAAKAETDRLRKQRRRERFIKRAEELGHLPGTQADDFAEILDAVNGAIPEKMFTKLNNLLSSWNEVVKKNDLLFREIGSNGGSMGMLSGAEAQLEALTREQMAADPKLSHAQAYDKVLKAHPHIYQKYVAEQGGK